MITMMNVYSKSCNILSATSPRSCWTSSPTKQKLSMSSALRVSPPNQHYFSVTNTLYSLPSSSPAPYLRQHPCTITTSCHIVATCCSFLDKKTDNKLVIGDTSTNIGLVKSYHSSNTCSNWFLGANSNNKNDLTRMMMTSKIQKVDKKNYNCHQHVQRFHQESHSLVKLLSKECNHIKMDTNPYELERHGRGESHHETRSPQVIVYPKTTAEVQDIVNVAIHHNIPLIPFGVGTSVEGHVCAMNGGISLDTSLLQTMQLPDFTRASSDKSFPDAMTTVGAGVTRKSLNHALRHSGLQFMVDPGADATLGGMVATGASGTSSVMYGTMRDNLLALECVLASGSGMGDEGEGGSSVVNLGSMALKNSAGYDLMGLLCGSEGTLGVITQVTVKLHPMPQHVAAAVCVFDNLHVAAQAVAGMKLQEISLARCELLDASSIKAFHQYLKSQRGEGQQADRHTWHYSESPTLFMELHAFSESSLKEQLAAVKEICTDYFQGTDFQETLDAKERQALWAARHQLYYATIQLRSKNDGHSSSAFVTDVCVPLSHLANVIEATAQDVKMEGLVASIFGHAGDGNFHCIFPIAGDGKEDPVYLEQIHAFQDRLVERALAVGGTCTGEHGVGYGKMKYLEKQYGIGTVHMMKMIKKALDPQNIMNPGKVVQSI